MTKPIISTPPAHQHGPHTATALDADTSGLPESDWPLEDDEPAPLSGHGELEQSELEHADLDLAELEHAEPGLAAEPMVERRQFEVQVAEHGLRIDRLLAARMPEFSRAWLQTLLVQGAVQLGGQGCSKPAHKVKVGEAIAIELRPTAQASAFVAEPMHLPVVYEDEHLLLLDKPAGLVVHPGAGNWSGTLLNGLLAHHAGAARLPRAGIVHRLDKDTSGLMVVAKTQPAFDALVRQIAARQVHRVYLALAHGAWRGSPDLVLRQPLGRDPRQRLRMAALPESASGARPALTQVRLLGGAGPVCLLGCKLHTGRTHQIRVHLSALGHPLVGDVLYGGRPLLGMQRQALHAHALALRHPISGQWLARCSAPAPDMAQALAAAGLAYNPKLLWPLETEPPAPDPADPAFSGFSA